MSFYVPAGFVTAGMITAEFGEIFSIDHSDMFLGKPVLINRSSVHSADELIEIVGNCYQIHVMDHETRNFAEISTLNLYRCSHIIDYNSAKFILNKILLDESNSYVTGKITHLDVFSQEKSIALDRMGNTTQEKAEDNR